MSGQREERMGLMYIFNFCRKPSCLGLAHKTYSIFVSCAFQCRLIFRVPLVSLCLTWFMSWLCGSHRSLAALPVWETLTILFRLGVWILSWWGCGVLWFPWWCLLTLLYLCLWSKKGKIFNQASWVRPPAAPGSPLIALLSLNGEKNLRAPETKRLLNQTTCYWLHHSSFYGFVFLYDTLGAMGKN